MPEDADGIEPLQLEFPLPPLIEDTKKNVAFFPSPIDLERVDTYNYELDEAEDRFYFWLKLEDESVRRYVFSTPPFFKQSIKELDDIYPINERHLADQPE